MSRTVTGTWLQGVQFAVNNVNLMVGPVRIQPQWIQNINTVCIVIGGPLLASFFTRMRAGGWRIDIPKQFATSLLVEPSVTY